MTALGCGCGGLAAPALSYARELAPLLGPPLGAGGSPSGAVLPYGSALADEFGRLRIGDGATPGGLPLTPQTVRDVRTYGARLDGATDDTAAFAAACAEPGVVVVPGGHAVISDAIPLTSNLVLEFQGKPKISLRVSGGRRGFWFPPGVRNAHIRGDADIEMSVAEGGPDGSYNCAFGFGVFSVGSDADHAPIRDCSVVGALRIQNRGPANGKAVMICGDAAGIKISGLAASGLLSFAFACHWSGDGAPGVLPRRTWHPDQILFEDCAAVGDGASTMRAFTASAGGRVDFMRCQARDAPSACLNLFVGDYGFTYAQNLSDELAMRHSAHDCDFIDCGPWLLVDGISSGLNGSPIWCAADHGAGNIHLSGRMRAALRAGHAGDLGGVSGVASVVVDNLDLTEQAPGQTGGNLAKFTAVGRVEVRGRARVGLGPLFRNCGEVVWRASLSGKDGAPQPSRYGIGASALALETTTIGAGAAGAESLTLAGSPAATGVGPGSHLEYDDGTRVHEIEILSYALPGTSPILLVCAPLPAAIPAGAAVRLVTTVKSLSIDACEVRDFATLIRLTGSAEARVRGLSVGSGFRGLRWLGIAADLSAAEDFEVGGFYDQGGLAESGPRSGVALGANARRGRAEPRLGRNCERLRYGLIIDDDATDVLYRGFCASIDASAVSPAAVYRRLSGVNRVAAGPPLAGPGVPSEYNPA